MYPGLFISRPLNKDFLAGLMTGSILIKLLFPRKYLTAISQNEDQITLTYLNQVGAERNWTINKTSLIKYTIKKKNFFTRNYERLYLYEAGRSVSVDIINKSLTPFIEKKFNFN